jgi:hypothetical protein
MQAILSNHVELNLAVFLIVNDESAFLHALLTRPLRSTSHHTTTSSLRSTRVASDQASQSYGHTLLSCMVDRNRRICLDTSSYRDATS